MQHQYRFIGTLCEYGEKAFSEIGDTLQMTADEAVEVIGRGRAAFIPEDLFFESGITEEEIRIYNPNHWFGEYPSDFAKKIERARELLLEYRAEILSPSWRKKDRMKPKEVEIASSPRLAEALSNRDLPVTPLPPANPPEEK